MSTHLNSICFNMVIAVTTIGLRPVDKACKAMLEEIKAVVNSVLRTAMRVNPMSHRE